MVNYQGEIGDIAGRMRRWEPCYFGPPNENACNIEAWSELEASKPMKYKNGQLIAPKSKPTAIGRSGKIKIPKLGKFGIFATVITLGATMLLGSKDKFCATA